MRCHLWTGHLTPSPGTGQGYPPAADKALLVIHSIIRHLLAVQPVLGARDTYHIVFILVSAHRHSHLAKRPVPDRLSLYWPIS